MDRRLRSRRLTSADLVTVKIVYTVTPVGDMSVADLNDSLRDVTPEIYQDALMTSVEASALSSAQKTAMDSGEVTGTHRASEVNSAAGKGPLVAAAVLLGV